MESTLEVIEENADKASGGDALTLEQVREVVNSSREVEDRQISELREQVIVLGDSVALLAQESGDGRSDEAYQVQIVSTQVETAKAALRLMCTESFLIVILLAVLVGLIGYRMFGQGWRRG